jgi:monoamine oxidase
LDKEEVLLNQSVQSLKFLSNSFQVIAKETFEAKSVVLAIPPKLWSKRITFQPSLPDNLIAVANHTHTWMEDSIKIALTYEQPFWQQENRSSTFFSNTGPITEFYDHCNHENSKYALCGFMSSSFKNLTDVERRASVLKQVKLVFGEPGEEYMDYEECVWSKETNTFVTSNGFLSPHQNNGNPIFSNSFFENKLFISGSESALEFPGYMDGAIYSGNTTAKKIMKRQDH